MTILKLKKELDNLIKLGYGKRLVCVDKSKITHPLEEDGCRIFPITSVNLDCHEMMDDDGGLKTKKNGETCYRWALVIAANH